ncbi:hypothetical protein EXIGLDRAFT_744653 [Exidia glandulosa HHB12029]|uniref:DUF7918 domain-containing protein n=1 Tax=Exidia glandulosa HHB12029 TaxID=1314781 RepID=A0A165PH62_EXIGL|nr:hypothetical protein EXIGLDRAFT_744653 [Exidia glandulosa HHB12029]
MLSLHGFEVAVVCDDKELETYGTTVNERTCSGWIATEVGKAFAIRMRQVAPGHHPRFQHTTYVDGKQVANMFGSNPDVYTLSGMYPTPTTFQAFHFAALRTTDDPAAGGSKDAEDMGTLKVVLRRQVEVSRRPSDSLNQPPTGAVVHERNKKRILGGQSIATGPTTVVSRLTAVTTRPYDPTDPDPYVTFIFKYRSHEYLLAEDIIPHIPRATPAKRKHEDTLSPDGAQEEDVKPAKRINLDELEEKQRKIRELKDQLRNAEAQVAEALDLPPPGLKREPFPFAVGAVVDLTGSDDDAAPPRRRVKTEPVIIVGDAGGAVIDLSED